MVSLVEKAEDAVSADEAAELTKKMMTGVLLRLAFLGVVEASVVCAQCVVAVSEVSEAAALNQKMM